VFGGMVAATLLAMLFVPAFFVFVVGLKERIARWRKPAQGQQTSE
jgi:multidrug efflux pump